MAYFQMNIKQNGLDGTRLQGEGFYNEQGLVSDLTLSSGHCLADHHTRFGDIRVINLDHAFIRDKPGYQPWCWIFVSRLPD